MKRKLFNKLFHARLFCWLIPMILIALYFMPADWFSSDISDSYCIHQRFFGIPCPGCGLTRATYNFLHINFERALNYNASVIFFIPYLASLIIYDIIKNNLFAKIKYLSASALLLSIISIYIFRFLNY